ncbi:MAG TPA: sigma-70 family RNA polymerase sigma factor [Steroidobacteraceae bacterium]|nr:sigma-70 family RNA polymerase sigma factor [Steroidobacteraceae bacterium]
MQDDMKDDRDLVAAMLAGEERAFTVFFETYFPRVYRFALPRLNRNADATKDVVQGTLIKAMRAIGDWRGEAALFTWLCQICRRQIADHVRSQRRHSDKVVLIDDSDEVRAALESIEAPETDDPFRGADRAELRRLVHAVLDRLPHRYGEALEWKYVEGRSVEEIGQRLGIGQTAAQSLLARARIAFREGLEAVFGASASDVLASLGT